MAGGDGQSDANLGDASLAGIAPAIVDGKGINLLLAPLMTVLAMLSVQLCTGLSKPMMAQLGPFGVSALRLIWASLFIVVMVRPRIHRFKGRQWRAALLLGLAMSAMSLPYMLSIQRIPIGLTSAIEFLGPLGVAAAGMRRWHHLVWPVLAAIGVGLLVRDREGWTVDLLGAGYAVLAAGGWAAYILASKKVGREFKGHDGLAVSILVSTLITLPFGYGELQDTVTIAALWQTAGLAVLTPLIAFMLEMGALRRMSTRSFGVLMSAEPAMGALIGLVLLGEYISLLQWIGIACVICASIGAVRDSGDS